MFADEVFEDAIWYVTAVDQVVSGGIVVVTAFIFYMGLRALCQGDNRKALGKLCCAAARSPFGWLFKTVTERGGPSRPQRLQEEV